MHHEPPKFQAYIRDNGKYYVFYPDINRTTGLMSKKRAKNICELNPEGILMRLPPRNWFQLFIRKLGG